jgi:RecJ-like exonuclease
LGKVMQEASTAVGGSGGGHDIAAGAFIPAAAEEEFLRRVDGLVGEMWSDS